MLKVEKLKQIMEMEEEMQKQDETVVWIIMTRCFVMLVFVQCPEYG